MTCDKKIVNYAGFLGKTPKIMDIENYPKWDEGLGSLSHLYI